MALALLAPTACSSTGDEGSVAVVDGPAAAESPADAAGPELRFPVTAVEELDTVLIDGLHPDDVPDTLELLVSTERSGPFTMPLFAVDGEVFTVVPVHLDTPGRGGTVTMTFVDDGVRGPEVDVELSPLPPTPGAWDAHVDELLDRLGRRAEAAGTTLAELAATPIEELVDGEQAIVKLLAGLVDDGTGADLESLAAVSDLSADEAALLDAMVAKIDPLDLLGPDDAEAPETAVGPTEPAGFRRVERITPVPLVSTSPIPAQARDCRVKQHRIADAAALADAVRIGVRGQQTDTVGVKILMEDVNALVGATGEIPVVGQVTGLIKSSMLTVALWLNTDGGTYPTSLDSLAADLTIDEFPEDSTETGRVARVTVVAASTGFDGSAAMGELTKAVVNALGGVLIATFKGEEASLGRELVFKGIEKLSQSATGQLINQFAEDAGKVVICPQQWTVDVSDPQYTQFRSLTGVLDAPEEWMTYEPRATGDDELRFDIRREMFQGLHASVQYPVAVKPLQVVSTPDRITVRRPGETVSITTELLNAETRRLSWDPGAGRWADGLLELSNDDGVRPLETPTDPDAYPFTVRITSLSDTGLRARATDERFDTVVIDLQRLVVQPDPGQVLTKGRLTFTATDLDGRPVAVSWQATGGSIDAGGTYTAGDRPGTYTVTATSIDDPSMTSTATVNVGEADCVVGTWELRSAEFIATLAAQMAGSGATPTFRSGSYRVAFADDGTYTSTRAGWTVAVQMPEGTVVSTIDGVETGTWSVDGDQLTLLDQGGSSDVSLTLEQGGVQLPIDSEFGVEVEPGGGTGAFDCDGDVLVTTFEGVATTHDRVAG